MEGVTLIGSNSLVLDKQGLLPTKKGALNTKKLSLFQLFNCGRVPQSLTLRLFWIIPLVTSPSNLRLIQVQDYRLVLFLI